MALLVVVYHRAQFVVYVLSRSPARMSGKAVCGQWNPSLEGFCALAPCVDSSGVTDSVLPAGIMGSICPQSSRGSGVG